MIATFVRTILLYLIMIFSLRFLGKRQIGEMEPAEFVVTMMAANLSTEPIEDPGSPILYSIIAILTILGTALLLSTLTMGSLPARNLLCGKPVILIENGVIQEKNMRKTRVTLDELLSQLREKEILDLTTVQYAILETNGGLSVFPFSKDRPATAQESGLCPKQNFLPVTIVEDGKLLEDNLEKAEKTHGWLRGLLRERGLRQDQVLLLTVDGAGHVVLIEKEEKP